MVAAGRVAGDAVNNAHLVCETFADHPPWTCRNLVSNRVEPRVQESAISG